MNPFLNPDDIGAQEDGNPIDFYPVQQHNTNQFKGSNKYNDNPVPQ